MVPLCQKFSRTNRKLSSLCPLFLSLSVIYNCAPAIFKQNLSSFDFVSQRHCITINSDPVLYNIAASRYFHARNTIAAGLNSFSRHYLTRSSCTLKFYESSDVSDNVAQKLPSRYSANRSCRRVTNFKCR